MISKKFNLSALTSDRNISKMTDSTSLPRILSSLVPTSVSVLPITSSSYMLNKAVLVRVLSDPYTAGLTCSPWTSLGLAMMFTTEVSSICWVMWKLPWSLMMAATYLLTVTADVWHSLPSMKRLKMPKFQAQWWLLGEPPPRLHFC